MPEILIITQSEGQEPSTATEPLAQPARSSTIWFWLCVVLLVIALVVGSISSTIGLWSKKSPGGTTPTTTPAPITTLTIERTAPYADLDATIVNAQYGDYFIDDNIRPGPATVRLNMQITNSGHNTVKINYYDDTRLIIPQTQPATPTNISIPTTPQPGQTASGWIDFAAPKNVNLGSLALQLGSTTMSESLVKIPFQGSFDASHYANQTYPQDLLFTYNVNGHLLNYHLTSVEARYAYQGSQCKVGQQFYVFNFTVDNPSGTDITPGFGFDYLRLVINNYSQPPIDNSLPGIFKANTSQVPGHVAFTGPANMHSLTLRFLSRNESTSQNVAVQI